MSFLFKSRKARLESKLAKLKRKSAELDIEKQIKELEADVAKKRHVLEEGVNQ